MTTEMLRFPGPKSASWFSDLPFSSNFTLFLSCSQRGRTHDPIFYASTQSQNAEPQTIFEPAWFRLRGRLVAVGHRPQTDALREAGSDRLRSGAAPRRRATWHPLVTRWSRAVDHGALLVDGICRVAIPAEAVAPSAHIGRPRSGVSAWVVRHACGTGDERDPALFLVNWREPPIDKRCFCFCFCVLGRSYRCRASAPCLPLLAFPFLLKLLFIYRIQRLSNSLQTRHPFLSSLVPRCITTYTHVTATGTSLQPSPSLHHHPLTSSPTKSCSIPSQFVPAWPATPIPRPSAAIMDVPASVPHPTAPIAHPPPPVVRALKDVNDVPLTRKVLVQALSELSVRLYRSSRRQVRLVMRGGSVMIL